jgi:hypothetical protein
MNAASHDSCSMYQTAERRAQHQAVLSRCCRYDRMLRTVMTRTALRLLIVLYLTTVDVLTGGLAEGHQLARRREV